MNEQFIEQLVGPAIRFLHADNMLTAFHCAHHPRSNGSAAASEDQGIFSAFQRSNFLSKNGNSGINTARIKRNAVFMLQRFAHLFHSIKAEIAALKNRRRDRAEILFALFAKVINDV